jgi:hypothetical protein
MTRLRALKDAELESRLGRLRRSQVALKQQIHEQINRPSAPVGGWRRIPSASGFLQS